MSDEPTALDPPEDVPAVSAERLVDGRLPAAGSEVEPDLTSRRYPSTIGGAFYLVMLSIAGAGLVFVVLGDWRTGVRLIGGALVFGSLVRLVLPSRDAGMLAVRSKLLDAVLLSGTGAAFFFLAATIPNQPVSVNKLLDEAEVLDRVALVGELGGGGIDAPAREVVDLETLHDGPLAGVGRHREGRHEALGNVVGAVGDDRHRHPVVGGGASSQSRAASTVADAAEAAEDEPRASMIAAPRLATVGMKSFSIHAWSPTTSAAFWPPTSAWNRSGYCVAEWLPQIVIFLISVTAAPVLRATWEMARLWSRRVRAENRSAGMSGALVLAISALVLAGFPVTPMRTSSAATLLSALPLRGEDRAVRLEQVAALHPGAARTRADEQREVDAVEDRLRVAADLDPGEVRERAVVDSMTTPSRVFSAGSISSSRSSIGRSGPRSDPLARRKSRL